MKQSYIAPLTEQHIISACQQLLAGSLPGPSPSPTPDLGVGDYNPINGGHGE